MCFFSVGKPIPVNKTENPTEVQIEEVHSTYVQALKELYEEYNPIYGDPKIQLNFTWIRKQTQKNLICKHLHAMG